MTGWFLRFAGQKHTSHQCVQVFSKVGNWPVTALASACILVYAAVAGLHTLSDFDLWWQMATGRSWFLEGRLPREDLFSYTVPGAPWTYPAGAGLIFFLLFRLGGYALVSLLAPIAAAGVALLLLRRGGLLRAWTVALALPAIVWRTSVRAELFTTVLTAAFLVLLWEHAFAPSGNRKAPLWLLPILMLAWVNLHPGFVLGVGLTVLLLAFSPRSQAKTLAPWAILTVLATLANPWGWRIYGAVVKQARALGYQQGFIGEWSPVPLSWEAASAGFRLRDPEGSYWLLLALALGAAGVAVWRRNFLAALLLVAAAAVSLRHLRFLALFAITAAVVVPEVLAHLGPPRRNQQGRRPWLAPAISAATLALLVSVRVTDLVSNRHYLSRGELATFGTGLAGWFPERAWRFVEEHRLPREIYHDYNLGGYLTWRAWPAYRVFIDGRALPFGPDLFFLQQRLARLGPESPEWRQALERWPIRTLVVSTARFGGFGALPLQAFCNSDRFRLVYLDETAAVFVRAGSQHQRWSGPGLTPLDCRSARLPPPPASGSAERFHFFANAGKLYYALERDAEAEKALEEARQIFEEDPALHLDLGQLRVAQGRMADAEREFRRAIALWPTPTSWFALGSLMALQGRHAEALECFGQSLARSYRPHESHLALGQSHLALEQPRQAREAFDRALRRSPFQGPAEALGRGFAARALSGRAAALLALQDAPSAVSDLERAASLAPSEPGLHLALARAYLAAGRVPDARRSLDRVRELGAAGPAVDQLEQQIRPGLPK